MVEGYIFGNNKFAVHDGPGVRTSVFLKGCPLHCQWCHNPEGQSFGQEVLCGDNGCLHCGKCRSACNNDPCIACGACIEACPPPQSGSARSLPGGSCSNRAVYEMSGGGITYSGGEPLSQAGFLFEVVSGVKPVHTAVETSGHAPAPVFLRALKAFDLIIMDV